MLVWDASPWVVGQERFADPRNNADYCLYSQLCITVGQWVLIAEDHTQNDHRTWGNQGTSDHEAFYVLTIFYSQQEDAM